MKLQELTIYNFMPYKGEQRIEFPQHDTQNVMLLFGDNMRGKTSFLNSIRWGFYGLALGRHSRIIPRTNLVNSIAASEGDWSMSIILKFTHENRQYELRRQLDRKSHVSIPKNDGDFEESIGLKIDNQVITGFLGLANWGEDTRRLNYAQAVRLIFSDMKSPMSIMEINAKVEELTGLEIDGTVTGIIHKEGGKYNPETRLWEKAI